MYNVHTTMMSLQIEFNLQFFLEKSTFYDYEYEKHGIVWSSRNSMKQAFYEVNVCNLFVNTETLLPFSDY